MSQEVYIKQITASEARWKLIVIKKESWHIFPEESTQITIVDSTGEYSTVFQIPRPDFRRIRSRELTTWINRNMERFNEGKYVKITPLEEKRYSIEILEEEDLGGLIREQEQETLDSGPHIEIISKILKIGKCDELKYVFVGRQERSRVENIASEASDPLSPYLIEQAEKTGNERIEQIDCIFLKEDDNLIIPTVLFEVELSGNYDAVINRVTSLLDSLSNKWFDRIIRDLVVVVVVPDERVQTLKHRIKSQGNWLQIRDTISVQVWGVSQVNYYYRSLVEEGNFHQLEILM